MATPCNTTESISEYLARAHIGRSDTVKLGIAGYVPGWLAFVCHRFSELCKVLKHSTISNKYTEINSYVTAQILSHEPLTKKPIMHNIVFPLTVLQYK